MHISRLLLVPTILAGLVGALALGHAANAQATGGSVIPQPPTHVDPNDERKTAGGVQDFDNPERAFDPSTGQNMFWDCVKKAWVDSKTGKPIPGGFNGRRGADGEVVPQPPTHVDPSDERKTAGGVQDFENPERAFDPSTGQNMFWDRTGKTWKDSKTGKAIPGGFNGRRAKKECPPPPEPKLDKTSSRILDIHNAERVAVGAQPLRWDPALAADASAYAAELAKAGQMAHAPREGRGDQRENLSEAFHGSSPEGLMGNWLSEKRYFHAGIFPNVCDGDWSKCAHYSQMIWPTTARVGCGAARGVQWDFFVCRYSPGGNKDGKPVPASGAALVKKERLTQPTLQPSSLQQPPAVEPTRVKLLDLQSMPIEVAVTVMFMLISRDARQEAREMLAEMQQVLNQKPALREAQEEMAKELMRLRALTRSEGEGRNHSLAKAQVSWANVLPTLCGALSGQARVECFVMQLKKRTLELQKLPAPK